MILRFIAVALVVMLVSTAAGPSAGTRSEDATINILSLGDSLSSCTGLNKQMTKGVLSFRRELWEKMQRDGLGENCSTFVGSRKGCNAKFDAQFPGATSFPPHHDAFFGRTTANAIEYLSDALKAKPNVVLLLLGTNDFLLQEKSVSEVKKNLVKIVEQLLEAKIAVLWASPPSISSERVKQMPPKKLGEVNKKLRALSIEIRNYVSTNQKKSDAARLDYVDLFDSVTSSMNYDGIHFNKQGTAHVASLWYAKLRPVLTTKCQRQEQAIGETIHTSTPSPTRKEPTEHSPPTAEENGSRVKQEIRLTERYDGQLPSTVDAASPTLMVGAVLLSLVVVFCKCWNPWRRR